MKIKGSQRAAETRAARVLKIVLAQVSGVQTREIRLEPRPSGHNREIVAAVDVLGHRHRLACAVASEPTETCIGEALSELRRDVGAEKGIIPVVIAPSLPPSARSMFKASKVSYVDFHGNVRLDLGEVFLWKRSLPHRAMHPAA